MKIGHYELNLQDVLVITKRTGWRAWLQPGYDVILRNGYTLRFTDAEKAAYDAEFETQAVVAQVYGMCKAMGLRG